MKTLVHIVDVSLDQNKILFQIPLPRNAKAIEGIRANLCQSEIFNFWPHSPLNNRAGTLCLMLPGSQSNFFADDFNIQNNNYHVDLLPPVQNYFFSNAEPWVHGKSTEFQTLHVELTAPFIEGYFENSAAMIWGDAYQVYIYLKISTT